MQIISKIIFVLFSGLPFCAQAQNLRADTSHHIRCGPPIAAGIILFEGIAAGLSLYAADKVDHGDKVMGWYYAACSAGMLATTVTEWICNRDEDKAFRVGEAVTMLGISYGLSRLATYNLLQSGNDSRDKIATRNFIEFHTTFIVPLLLGELATTYIAQRQQNSRIKTSVHFTGQGVMLAVRF